MGPPGPGPVTGPENPKVDVGQYLEAHSGSKVGETGLPGVPFRSGPGGHPPTLTVR